VHWHPRPQGPPEPFWFLATGAVRLWARWLRIRVEGREHLDGPGGTLVVANHLADVDPPFLLISIDPPAPLAVTAERHFRSPVLGRLMSTLCSFPVAEDRADPRGVRYARDWLARGRTLLIFPEGSPSFGPHVGAFAPGVGHLALTPGVRVVPGGIWGTHRVMTHGLPLGRGPVTIRFGRPVPVPGPGEGSRRARAESATARAREAVAEIVSDLAREERGWSPRAHLPAPRRRG
jgi:1-acyl-sn-glycerol-3-phosphate acyltransferase